MAKSMHYVKTTHRFKVALNLNIPIIVSILLQEHGILTSMLEEIQSLKNFLNHHSYTCPSVSHETISFTFICAVQYNPESKV